MPLTHSVNFQAGIGKGNRIQIPNIIRWEFKLESAQLLNVHLGSYNHGIDQTFYVKMNKDGRITVSKLNTALIINELGDETSIFHIAFDIRLEPAFDE